jgi:hypothetical protein
VNLPVDDRKLAEKIAQDILYQFVDFCEYNITETAIKDYNLILKKEETERNLRQKEEELRLQELEELARLKAKYETKEENA